MNHANLWAPWRMAYLRDLLRKTGELGEAAASPGNFFAEYWAHPELDDSQHVIHRDSHGMIMLNRYPYANGHVLVALGEGRPTLLDYDETQRQAFWSLIEAAASMMRLALSPQGINYGINEGKAAGAGVPEHLHAHLVPRWNADTNFITVVGDVRIIPDSLEQMHQHYRRFLQRALAACRSRS
jgi:ATP adenylyltransferase